MTNQKAIEILKIERDHMTPTLLAERIEAMDMAISALQEQETCDDTISRQAAIDDLYGRDPSQIWDTADIEVWINALPSVQPERDIPMKPTETTDKAWGIPHRQAVCPKCDYYLGHVAFLGDYKGKRITYCETCGQAIDWEGWEFDE